jgi:hypothetical protein
MFRLLTFLLVILPLAVHPQINFSGGGKMRIMEGGKLIIMNPITDGINFTDGGGIITDGENAQVILHTKENTGRYTIPFLTPSGNTIPYTYDMTTAGVGTDGMVVISSWATSSDNTVNAVTSGPGLPSSVTQFVTENEWGNWAVQGGQKVINRFWSIRHVDYSVQPRGDYVFTYHLSEKPGPLVESQLVAQRWNDVDNTWLDWLYSNTANTVTKTVTVSIQNPEDQFSIWTLTDISDPLPIELARFIGDCDGDGIRLSWTTWSEIDNREFIVERSTDGLLWTTVSIVPGAGDSNTPLNYSVFDDGPGGVTLYYRLIDVDGRGNTGISRVIAVTCDRTGKYISLHPNPTDGKVFVTGVFTGPVKVRDVTGREVNVVTYDNVIDMGNVASGTYMVSVDGTVHKIIRR